MGSAKFSIFEFQSDRLEGRETQGHSSMRRGGEGMKIFHNRTWMKTTQPLQGLPVTVEQ